MSHLELRTRQQTQAKGKSVILSIASLLWIMLIVVACQQTEQPDTACIDICVDEVLQSYYQVNNLDELFGEPYSALLQLIDENGAEINVQYFNGGRLDYNPTTETITIAALGEWAYEGLDLPQVATVPNGEVECFGQVAPCVQGAFLDFYRQSDGLNVFGLPISEQLNEGDLRVQYFENVRLEWHPEAPTGQQVRVGFIGRAHYLYTVYEAGPQALIPKGTITQIESVDITAAVHAPILYSGEEQIVYLLVQNPQIGPVDGLDIKLVISHQGDSIEQTLTAKTAQNGTSQAIVDLSGLTLTPGQDVQIEAFAYQDGESDPLGSTIITFKAWW